MSYIEKLLVKHVKLSSIDEAKLLRKRVSLRDSLEVTQGIAKELQTVASRSKVVETVGVMVILTSLVSDIIRDAIGGMVSQRNPLMKLGLEKIYDKARDKKWKGNKYEKEIEAIKTNGGYLEDLAKLDKSGMWKMTINIHKTMVMNVVGLIGYVEEAKDGQRMLVKAITALQNNIEALEKERQRVDFYLETGDGGGPLQRFTPMAAPVVMGGLG